MRPLRAWLIRLTTSIAPSRREREMAEEFESHLQLHVDDNIRAGMTPAEARRQALVKFGADRIRQGVTTGIAPAGPSFGRIGQDLRFAARLLRKAPAFSVTAILTIAMAVGVNAAIFTVSTRQRCRRCRCRTAIASSASRSRSRGAAGAASAARGACCRSRSTRPYAIRSRAFEGVLAYSPANEVTLGGAEPRTVLATLATCNYFDVLQVRPILGRPLTAADCAAPGAGGAAVISHELWTSGIRVRPRHRRPHDLGESNRLRGRRRRAGRIQRHRNRRAGDLRAGHHVGGRRSREQAVLECEPQLADGHGETAARRVAGSRRGRISPWSRRRLTAAESSGRVSRLSARQSTLAALPEVRTTVLGIAGVMLAAVDAGAAHRLRQHREPAAGARDRAAAGDCGAHGARRRTAAGSSSNS